MEWNGIELIAGMGGTVVRSSSIPPGLLHTETLRAIASHHHTVSCHHSHSKPLVRISLPLFPKPLPQQTSFVSHSTPFSFLSSSPTPFRCFVSSSSVPCVSLMSSRLASAYSSFCGSTQFESKRYRGPKCRAPGSVQASVEFRSNSLSSDRCWKEGRVRGKVSSSRCMGNETSGQRIECYSSSSDTAAAGGNQPISSSSVLPPTLPALSKIKGSTIKFCPRCGAATEEKIPLGEHEKRYVCTACGAVHYQNPKMVVGCLVEHEGKILLCRRNIEPSYGLWTLPAGYMEMGESAAEGAARETLEEACAHVQVLALFAHLDIPLIGQSHIYFRAQLKDPHFAPGPESIECALFKLNEIPFDNLAFSSIQVALKMYIEDTEAGKWRVHHAVIDKRPGAGPSDLKGFLVRDVLST